MDRVPPIGSRVRYAGSLVVGPCVGVVVAVYPSDEWNDALDKPTGRFLPEREWHVAMRPDKRPALWCYGNNDTFAPQVSKLRRA